MTVRTSLHNTDRIRSIIDPPTEDSFIVNASGTFFEERR